MGYIALYRKYRPQTFNDIVGQENVTKILKNQIKSGKVSHAYIFSGTRGTGKTSAAKVFSRAINCLNPKDGEPCNECEVCKNILEGNTTDVVEMDAASNNSVENIRQIRQEVIYATVDVKYRVYIIDEAHMLTTSAFNALLKTLEEPPANVIFILATTESHKIPVTILSRCLRFDFDRLSEENISKRLQYICDKENIKYEVEAIDYISKIADGALRDGISVLDRCISQTNDILKLDNIKKMVGAIDDEVLNKIIEDVYSNDIIGVLECIDDIIKKGKDLRNLISNLNEKFLACLIDTKDETKKDITINIIDRLAKLDNDLKTAVKPSILLKANMVEICNNPLNTNSTSQIVTESDNESIKSLNKKILNLENEIVSIKKRDASNIVQDEKKITKKLEENRSQKDENITNQVVNMSTFENSEDFKKFILKKGNIKIYSAIASANIFFKEDILVIMTLNSFAYNLLKDNSNIDILKTLFKEKYNKEVVVKIGLNEKNENSTLKIEQLFKEKDVNYTKMD